MIICSVSSSGFIAVSLFRAFSVSGVSFCSPCLSFYQCRKKANSACGCGGFVFNAMVSADLEKVQWVMKTYADAQNHWSMKRSARDSRLVEPVFTRGEILFS